MPSTVIEKRLFERAELRLDSKGGFISGYAARYNVLSGDLGGFRERLLPGAFSRAIREKQDVRHLVNHDPNKVLGRTASGTTSLSEDANGLRFRTMLPDTSYAHDLVASVRRGDINQCSFAFSCVADRFDVERDPATGRRIDVRLVSDLILYDISTVTYPAYPQTSAEMSERSLPAGLEISQEEEDFRRVIRLQLCLRDL